MKSHRLQLVVALVIAGIALAGCRFWYAAVAEKSKAVADLQGQIAAKTTSLQRGTSARAALAEMANDEAVLQKYVVPGTGVVAFIEELQSQGNSLGSTVNVLSVSTGSVNTQPTLILALSVTGTFDAVIRTIGAIEYAPYKLSVSGLSLEQDGRNSWHATMDLIVGSSNATTTTL